MACGGCWTGCRQRLAAYTAEPGKRGQTLPKGFQKVKGIVAG
jgi:hypothetical protein